jgi:hypothetical protein
MLLKLSSLFIITCYSYTPAYIGTTFSSAFKKSCIVIDLETLESCKAYA